MEPKKSIADLLRELPNENPVVTHGNLLYRQWKILRIVQIISMVLLFAAVFSIQALNGISLILTAITAMVLFSLSKANPRYRTASILVAVHFVCTILCDLFQNAGLLVLPTSIVGLLAVFQEFRAHSDVLQKADGELSWKWSRLFYWYLGSVLVALFSTLILSTLIVLFDLDQETTYWIVTAVTYLPELAVDIFYLLYLNRSIRLVSQTQTQ